MLTILLIVLLILFLGGFGYRRYAGPGVGWGGVDIVLLMVVVLIIVMLFAHPVWPGE